MASSPSGDPGVNFPSSKGPPADPAQPGIETPHNHTSESLAGGEGRGAHSREDRHAVLASTVKVTAAQSSVAGDEPKRRAEARWPRIDGYEVIGLLGSGAMGRVYKARHTKLKRLVALKVILAGDYAGPEEVARFREEAEAIARLKHPNIIQIHEVSEQNGHPFLALEFVEGGSLASQLRGIPLPVRQATQLVATLARAIHTAHQQGVIHRDLKPANILLAPPAFLTSDGRGMDGWVPKITDFGLAKKLDDSPDLTLSGAIMGTPQYMAPEQAWGRSRDIGPSVDIYALGAMLYELLTGRAPFQGTKMEVLDQVRQQPPPPLRRLEPDIPSSLETICLKCLEKEPARRYSSASALASDLRRFLEDKPILARPVAWPLRIALWSRRNKRALAGAAFLTAALGRPGLAPPAGRRTSLRNVGVRWRAVIANGKIIKSRAPKTCSNRFWPTARVHGRCLRKKA